MVSNESHTYRLHRVNPKTWMELDEVAGVMSCRIESATSMAEYQKGTITVDGTVDAGYYRISAVVSGAYGVTRRDIATLLCSPKSGSIGHDTSEVTLDGRSVLYPATVRYVPDGSYAPRGVDGAEIVADLLSEVLTAPVEITGGFVLDQNVAYDLGASYLSAARAVLEMGSHVLQIDGRGTVLIGPRQTVPVATIGAGDGPLVELSSLKITPSRTVWDVPNVYKASVTNGGSASWVNDDGGSPTSTVTLGMVHERMDRSPARVDGETLEAYARRRLAEESYTSTSVSYKRGHVDGVMPHSLVRMSLPTVDGDMTVERSSIVIDGNGGYLVEESATLREQTWEP